MNKKKEHEKQKRTQIQSIYYILSDEEMETIDNIEVENEDRAVATAKTGNVDFVTVSYDFCFYW